MNASTLKKVREIFLQHFGIPDEMIPRDRSFPGDKPIGKPDEFISQLLNHAAKPQLVFISQHLSATSWMNEIREQPFPVMAFAEKNGELLPVILRADKKSFEAICIRSTGEEEKIIVTNPKDFPGEWYSENIPGESEKKILVATCIPVQSDESENQTVFKSRYPLLQKLGALLRQERREIGYIFVYALIAGLISLSLPLGIQSIVGFVSAGQLSTSLVMLITFIVLGMLIVGLMQIMQMQIVEHIQQKLFAKTAFDFAFRIPRIRIESILKHYAPELINRFFDIVTLQKGMVTLLIEFSGALLQILFGVLLLALYHPYFILFGLLLVAVLWTIMRLTGPSGLSTSISESKYKYQVANWLEELARAMNTFRLSGTSTLALGKTDDYVGNYLQARQKHFRVLLWQYMSFVLFKTIVTAGLLILGCALVLSKEINLGQFIAAEIIIILIMNAVEKILQKLDTFYDILTSIDKLSAVTDLPLDTNGMLPLPRKENGLAISLQKISYRFPDRQNQALDNVSFDIQPGETVCISGNNGSGRTTLINILLGSLKSYQGSVLYDRIPMQNLDRDSMLSQIGDYVAQEELFDGTLLENITLGRSGIGIDEITEALQAAGLNTFIQTLPEGLNTRLIGGTYRIPGSVSRKIILARCIVARPRLLILDEFLYGIERREKERIIDYLTSGKFSWTILFVANDPIMMKKADRVLYFSEGKLIAEGSYENLLRNDQDFCDMLHNQ